MAMEPDWGQVDSWIDSSRKVLSERVMKGAGHLLTVRTSVDRPEVIAI